MMLLQRRRQYLKYCCFLSSSFILLVFYFPLGSAYGDVFVMNSSLVCDACENFCDTSQVDYNLINDCQRGCRIFDTALNSKASLFAHFDDMAALTNCHNACKEAYGNIIMSKLACSDGCTEAQHKYNKIYTLSLQWLQDMQRNMTFFETLLEVTGSIVFPSAIGVDADRFVEEVSPYKPDVKKRIVDKLDPIVVTTKKSFAQKTSSEVVKQSFTSMPNWITQSVFVLITLGVIMIVGVGCYCCIFAHLIRQSRKMIVDTDLPPSYEQLMRSGFVVVPNGSQDCFINDKQVASPLIDVESLTVDTILEPQAVRFVAHPQANQRSVSL